MELVSEIDDVVVSVVLSLVVVGGNEFILRVVAELSVAALVRIRVLVSVIAMIADGVGVRLVVASIEVVTAPMKAVLIFVTRGDSVSKSPLESVEPADLLSVPVTSDVVAVTSWSSSVESGASADAGETSLAIGRTNKTKSKKRSIFAIISGINCVLLDPLVVCHTHEQ